MRNACEYLTISTVTNKLEWVSVALRGVGAVNAPDRNQVRVQDPVSQNISEKLTYFVVISKIQVRHGRTRSCLRLSSVFRFMIRGQLRALTNLFDNIAN